MARIFQAGVRGGVGLTYVKTDGVLAPHLMIHDSEFARPDLKMYFGLSVNINILKGLRIQAEGNLQPMGFIHQYNDGVFMQSKYYEFSYVSVPVLLKYNKWGLGLLAGMQYNRLYKATKGESDQFQGGALVDVREDMYKVDWGWIAGLEYTLSFGLGFNIRYYQGMNNIARFRSNTFTTRNAMYNRYIQFLGLHYYFMGNTSHK